MNIKTRIVTLAIIAILGCIAACAHAEENCNAWRTAETDPTGGQYLLELRTCDLTYGLSAYIQIRNSGDRQLQLSYRLTTKDDKSKDGEVTLDANAITRAGNCQACAKRYAGLKSWDIVSIKALAKAVAPASTETPNAASSPAPEQSPVAAQPPPVSPVKEKVIKAAEPASAVVSEQPKAAEKPITESKAVSNPPTAEQTPKAEKKSERDGFKAEDGTIIPFDQLPPEFRPRK